MKFRALIPAVLSLVAMFSVIGIGRADENITQYRYRSFDGTTPPDWVSTYGSGTVLPDIVKIERGTATDAFQQFWYATFNGNKRYVCADDVPGNDLSADFTVTAWLNLNTTNGTQTICSTLDGGNKAGFRFLVQNGRLKGEAWYNDENTSPVLHTVTASNVLETSQWRRVTFRRVKDGTGEHFMDLWIDSNRAGMFSVPYAHETDHSTFNPVFGANRSGGGFNDYLNAKVYCIQVDDYGLSDFFLSSPIVRDGSRYFGMPSYHDYLGEGAANEPLERRIIETYERSPLTNFRSRLSDRWMFPFANDNYVPQGFTSDQEGSRIFSAMYYKDERGTISERDYPSIIAEILMPEGRLGNVFVLQDMEGNQMASHVGGIVYMDGLLIVPGNTNDSDVDPDLLVYDISAIPPATFNPDTLENLNPREIRAVQVISRAADTGSPLVNFDIAFIDAFYAYTNASSPSTNFIAGERLQWLLIGPYDSSEECTNVLYRLQVNREAGPPFIRLTEKRSQRAVTENMQGAATYFAANSVMRSFQAGSGGNVLRGSESRLESALYTNFLSTTGVQVPTNSANVIFVPQGVEQPTFYDGKLWTISESGARYFQKNNSPWTNCFPFFYSINVQDRLDTNGNGLDDEWETTMFGRLTSIAPNIDTDLDKLSNRQEYLADTHPRSGNDYPNVQLTRQPDGGSAILSFPTSVLRFYTIESSSDLVTWTPSNSFKHRRGTDGIMSTIVSLGANRAPYFRIRIEDK